MQIYRSTYIPFILRNMPKILTQVDRDPDSPNFGCCDRNYWHLKIRDFSSAILQQTCLTMALLSSIDFDGNKYFSNKNVLNWARGAMEFWGKIQLRDGSFNEYYPNEHGFPPTAFSLFAVAYSYRYLNLQDPLIVKKMEKTARFLVNNIEKKALNQEAASISALYQVYLITGNSWIKAGLDKKMDMLLSSQSAEGWFPEYNGADIGYLSVCFDMLSEYFYQSKDEKIARPLEKILDFIRYFCHPDKTCGGEYGSRNTIYFLPNGLEVMIWYGNKIAMDIKNHLFEDTDSSDYFQNSIDDRYFTHYVMHSFLRALYKEQKNNEGSPATIHAGDHRNLPCFKNHINYFKESGLFTFRNDNYFAVVNLKKGGIVKAFDDSNEVFCDFGYRIVQGKNILSTTNWLDDSYAVGINNNVLNVSGSFNRIKLQTSSPLKHIILRILSLISYKIIKRLLKNRLIFLNKHDKVEFHREISLNMDSISIKDIVRNNISRKTVASSPNLSLRHVASDKFFSRTDLEDTKKVEITDKVCATVRQVFDFKNKKIEIRIEDE